MTQANIPAVPATLNPGFKPLAERLYSNAMRGCPADACAKTVAGWSVVKNGDPLIAYGQSVVAAVRAAE